MPSVHYLTWFCRDDQNAEDSKQRKDDNMPPVPEKPLFSDPHKISHVGKNLRVYLVACSSHNMIATFTGCGGVNMDSVRVPDTQESKTTSATGDN